MAREDWEWLRREVVGWINWILGILELGFGLGGFIPDTLIPKTNLT